MPTLHYSPGSITPIAFQDADKKSLTQRRRGAKIKATTADEYGFAQMGFAIQVRSLGNRVPVKFL